MKIRPADMIDKIEDFRRRLAELSAYLGANFSKLWDKHRADYGSWYLFKVYVESKAYMRHLNNALNLLQEELSVYEE